MKTLLVASIACFSLALSSPLFAGCYSAGNIVSCESTGCGPTMGSPYITECMCTDPSVIRHNPCLTTAQYCQEFGNVGGLSKSW